jgi:hypothetical protein
MRILTLKKQYEGLIVTKTVFGVGTITFDPNKATPKQYENFSKCGFNDLFETIEVCDDCLLENCACIINEINLIEPNCPEETTIEFIKTDKKEIIYDGIKKTRGRKPNVKNKTKK